jgi:diadenosine tetraphosphate (Ap4A) HIT family hydrolase
MTDDCYSCRQEAALDTAAPSERIHVDDLWRAAHAFDSALPGWLVVVPRRHVTAIADLTPDEAATLGPLLWRLSRALRDALGCAKTYVAQFAEKEGFGHVHFHLVPRGPDLPPEHRGPKVFALLGRPPGEALTAEARDRVAADIGRQLTRA